jgi:hypothetical protein
MSCVLRATGIDFDPDSFLANSSLEPCNVYHCGERRSKSSTWQLSGFTVAVSNAPFEHFQSQVDDALNFLRTHEAELQRLRSYEGVTDVRLDFAVSERARFVQSTFLPAELLERLLNLQIGLEISVYSQQLTTESEEARNSRKEVFENLAKARMKFLDLVDALCKYPKMYTENGTYGEVIAHLDGYAHGRRLFQTHYSFSQFDEWLRKTFSEDSAERMTIADRDDHGSALAEFARLYRQYLNEQKS